MDGWSADYLIPIMLGVGLWVVVLVVLAWYGFRRPPRKYRVYVVLFVWVALLVPVALASWPFAGVMLAAWAPAGILAWLGAARQSGSPQAHSQEDGADRDAHLHQRR